MNLYRTFLVLALGAFAFCADASAKAPMLPSAPSNVEHLPLAAAADAERPFGLPEHYVFDSTGTELVARHRAPDWLSSETWKTTGPRFFSQSGKELNDDIGNLLALEDRLRNRYALQLPAFELGKQEVAVVQFWADWCAPCVEEMHEFVQLAETSGTRVVWITIDLSLATVMPRTAE
jgi:thiol-disulfide isomerase/thioredoxin